MAASPKTTTPSPKKSGRSSREEEEATLKEVCSSNGLNFNHIDEEAEKCLHLEAFFSGFTKMTVVSKFPNLQTLCLMGQMVKRIEGLSAATRLTELWICESEIRKIEGLESCKMLRKLYLYTNEITQMENLGHLLHLEVLWMNGNNITTIDGLSGLKCLRELNLAENFIDKIGHSLNGLVSLHNLELSGNRIWSFKDLTHLTKLSSLNQLGLKSPSYAPNPVCLLCNYSTHILYHLPGLARLDTIDVSTKSLRDMAETTVLKKKMYYNMRVKTIKRNLTEMVTKVSQVKDELCHGAHERLRALHFAIKEIQREVQEVEEREDEEDHESSTESDKDAKVAQAANERPSVDALCNKEDALMARVQKWEKKCEEVDYYFHECSARLRQAQDVTVNRLMAELESGGNIRFEDGKSSDVWFTSCHDLILSRFCAADYKEHGILGLKINRITRVHNRILRTRFDEALSALIDEDDHCFPAPRNNSYKKLLEYLFWVWDPALPGGQHEPARVVEEGFMDIETSKKLGKDAAVPLSNSVSLAERFRIAHIKKQPHSKHSDLCPFRHGQLIIAKVYIGKSTQVNDDKLITGERFSKMDSVFRPRQHSDSCKQAQRDSGVAVGVTSQASQQPCECSSRQCEWFIFDESLVMPEYIIDFEYITRLRPKSPFAAMNEAMLEVGLPRPLPSVDDQSSDEDVLKMEPQTKPRPRMIMLSDELLMKAAHTNSLTNIWLLNLHGNGLTKLKQLQSLPLLKKLIISFNELTKLDDLAHLAIEYLDASFNKIATLDGMKSLTKLKHLDLSWNQLHSTRDEISILRKHTPALVTLDLRHNFWQKPEGLRLRAIGRLKSLTMLNGSSVTENEATAALRMAAGSRISQVSLLSLSRTDNTRPRSLSLATYAQVLTQTSRCKPDRVGDQDNVWYLKVTTLNLDSQHISKLSNLERLENLRWASFNDNDITKIEGLETCYNLEELSLEQNCITKLEGVSKLTKLRWLSLSHNYISNVDGGCLDRLTQLHHLSLESNRISSLVGLQRVSSLMELYLGNNRIENIRDIFYLKNLNNLIILDLYGNPVIATANNYRLFIIYHLKSLKALDGTAIEVSEGSQAKDAFGGRLTADFVAERLGHVTNFNEVRELDFPQMGIRTVDLGSGDQFINLRSVNLENNNLTSFSGLIHLVNLRVLCLNHNQIEGVTPRPRQQSYTKSSGYGMNMISNGVLNPENFTPVLENLEVLHLGYNGIKDLASLQLSRLTSLKALFLQGNEITKVEGLEGLQDLRELVLDRNKIKNVSEFSFMNQWNLQELHMEENRIRDLSNLATLENLQRLYLGMNRIQDLVQVDKITRLQSLAEVSLVENPVARRLLHRPMLVYRMPSLIIIDGIPVTEEERTKAELYFMEQQPPQITTTIETTLPGIGQYKTQIPVKVTNMQLMNPPGYDKTWGGTIHYSEDAIQQELQRGAGRRRNNRSETIQHAISTYANSRVSGTLSYQHAANSQHGGSYSNAGSRSQHQMSQVPYVPHQGHDYMGHTDSLTRAAKNARR